MIFSAGFTVSPNGALLETQWCLGARQCVLICVSVLYWQVHAGLIQVENEYVCMMPGAQLSTWTLPRALNVGCNR